MHLLGAVERRDRAPRNRATDGPEELLQHPRPSSKVWGRLNSYLRYTGLGIQFVVIFAFFVWGGHLIDGWVGGEIPWFLLLGGLLGAGVATYKLYRTVFEPIDRERAEKAVAESHQDVRDE